MSPIKGLSNIIAALADGMIDLEKLPGYEKKKTVYKEQMKLEEGGQDAN